MSTKKGQESYRNMGSQMPHTLKVGDDYHLLSKPMCTIQMTLVIINGQRLHTLQMVQMQLNHVQDTPNAGEIFCNISSTHPCIDIHVTQCPILLNQ